MVQIFCALRRVGETACGECRVQAAFVCVAAISIIVDQIATAFDHVAMALPVVAHGTTNDGSVTAPLTPAMDGVAIAPVAGLVIMAGVMTTCIVVLVSATVVTAVRSAHVATSCAVGGVIAMVIIIPPRGKAVAVRPSD